MHAGNKGRSDGMHAANFYNLPRIIVLEIISLAGGKTWRFIVTFEYNSMKQLTMRCQVAPARDRRQLFTGICHAL